MLTEQNYLSTRLFLDEKQQVKGSAKVCVSAQYLKINLIYYFCTCTQYSVFCCSEKNRFQCKKK